MEMFSNDYIVCMQTDQNILFSANNKMKMKAFRAAKLKSNKAFVARNRNKQKVYNNCQHLGTVNIAQVRGILYMHNTWLWSMLTAQKLNKKFTITHFIFT